MTTSSRRTLLGGSVAAAAFGPGVTAGAAAESPAAGFPVLDVRAFGAAGDGQSLDTRAIQAAIDKAEAAGGGWVYVPPGNYVTGTLHLKNRVTLYLEAGATIRGSGVGLWMRDGGLIEGWTVNNISMTLTGGGQPIYMTSYPRSRLPEPGARREEERPAGTVRSIMISDVTAIADGCIFLSGMAEKPLEGIVIENVRIRMQGGRQKDLHAEPPYPFPVWGHRRSPCDVFCRYVDGLKLRDIHLTWGSEEKPEWGSAIRCRDVTNLEIAGFNGRQSLGSDAPAISLAGTRHAYIHDCWAPEGTGVFLSLDPGAGDVALMNNNLSRAREAAVCASGVDRRELHESGNRTPKG